MKKDHTYIFVMLHVKTRLELYLLASICLHDDKGPVRFAEKPWLKVLFTDLL